MKLCLCGCGQEVKKLQNRFIYHHHCGYKLSDKTRKNMSISRRNIKTKTQIKYAMSYIFTEAPLCKCGCGQKIQFKTQYKTYGYPEYISGHNRQDIKHTIETREKIGKSNLGKIGSNKGKRFSIEIKEKIRKSVKRSWDILTPEQKEERIVVSGVGKYEEEILDREEKERGIQILRHYPVIGFILDGYCEKSNTAYEVDEIYHEQPIYKDYDQRRQHMIEKKLGCNFIRINVREFVFYEDPSKTFVVTWEGKV